MWIWEKLVVKLLGAMDLQVLRICRSPRLDIGQERVSWVRRYQGQCRALEPLGHQGYRLRNYKKDPPLCSGYTHPLVFAQTQKKHKQQSRALLPLF